MNFLSPLAFALVAILPIIIVMYLLKLRRPEHIVSSIYLWQRIVRDVEANAPWQRLRKNMLLWLQLLFLLFLIFALARPVTVVEGSNSQNSILIFDISASMSATDIDPDGPNRLTRAKDQARLLISNLPQKNRITIIAAGNETQVLISSSQDKRLLLQALDDLLPETGGSDMTSALELASAIARHQDGTDILIYSDGNIDLPDRLALYGDIHYNPIGISDNNQAISLISLEPGTKNDFLTAFIQVINYSDEPVQRRLLLRTDGNLVDVQDINLAPHDQVNLINDRIPSGSEVLEASLEGSDDLRLDDTVWTVHQTSGNHNVALISQGNRFLETALNSLPGVNTTVINHNSVKDYALEEASVVIYDAYTPTIPDLPPTNQFFISPLSDSKIFSVTGRIENPMPILVSDNDPLTKYLDFSHVNIYDSQKIPLPNWAQPVVLDEYSNNPLLFHGEIEGKRLVVLTFDPIRSDLPLQVTYPILIANIMDWLLPGRLGDIPDQVSPGQVIKFSVPPGISQLTVELPDGSKSILMPKDGQAIFSETRQLGIYNISWGDNQSLIFPVNLSSLKESDIHPQEEISLVDKYSTLNPNLSGEVYREWWRPLVVIALIIIGIEWLVYNRIIFFKLGYQFFRNLRQSS